jgi:hypothetical protein
LVAVKITLYGHEGANFTEEIKKNMVMMRRKNSSLKG